MGAESIKLFGEEYFGIISAILTLLILVLSDIIPKTIGASYWRSLAIASRKKTAFFILHGNREYIPYRWDEIYALFYWVEIYALFYWVVL